jgi:putative toxin-antitoxin system antitoxin component (TIGR02293 family)
MSQVEEAAIEYKRTGTLSTTNRTLLMKWVREGLDYFTFQKLSSKYPFTIEEWSKYLHISERTIQRYKKDFKNFDALQSEKILQISFLYQRGVEIFGDKENFDLWLQHPNIALGNIKPKDLLDNAFGITLLEEELSRIEHGILA